MAKDRIDRAELAGKLLESAAVGSKSICPLLFTHDLSASVNTT